MRPERCEERDERVSQASLHASTHTTEITQRVEVDKKEFILGTHVTRIAEQVCAQIIPNYVVNASQGRGDAASFPQQLSYRRVVLLRVQFLGRLKQLHALSLPCHSSLHSHRKGVNSRL